MRLRDIVDLVRRRNVEIQCGTWHAWIRRLDPVPPVMLRAYQEIVGDFRSLQSCPRCHVIVAREPGSRR